MGDEREGRGHIALKHVRVRRDGGTQNPLPVEYTFLGDICVIEEGRTQGGVVSLVNTDLLLRRRAVDEAGCNVGDVGIPVLVRVSDKPHAGSRGDVFWIYHLC